MTQAIEAITERAPGLYAVGEFLNTEQQRDEVKGDKTYPGKFLVKLLVGDRVINIEYRDEETAQELAGVDGLHRGDLVALSVGVRSAKGYTFYFGRQG